jgi:hypothetical protein
MAGFIGKGLEGLAVLATFAAAIYLAYNIRLYAIINYGRVIHGESMLVKGDPATQLLRCFCKPLHILQRSAAQYEHCFNGCNVPHNHSCDYLRRYRSSSFWRPKSSSTSLPALRRI